MKILLDECIPYSIYNFLKKQKYKVEHVNKIGLSGSLNGKIYHTACKEYQVFVTNDRHFRNPRKYPPTSALGVLVFRVTPSLPETQLLALKKFLLNHNFEQCIGKLVILRK